MLLEVLKKQHFSSTIVSSTSLGAVATARQQEPARRHHDETPKLANDALWRSLLLLPNDYSLYIETCQKILVEEHTTTMPAAATMVLGCIVVG
jgi:hypothetical protein